jgi:serine/threonine protein kinase
MASIAPDDSGVAIGTVLAGRYRIGGVLGRGGMGRVYLGEHTAIGKPVAVKVLHKTLGANREAATRFQREAIASGRLDHPNIVSVMDFGALDDGSLYLVMEALDGEHLGQRIARAKRIPWTDALVIARGVLLGLHHAHDRGVVHRDIKPDNIFLANKEGETVVKVLDFGIAKLYIGSTDDQTATRVGITVGTPTYLSPEQATGGAITPASDIYSTSIVLYEMLVGRAPFESDDPLTLLTSHAGTEVPPFAELAPDLALPDGIEALVRCGLAKHMAERIDCAAYVQTIDEILCAHGIDIAPAPLTPRASLAVGIPIAPFAVPTPFPANAAGTPAPSQLTRTPIPALRPPTRRRHVIAALVLVATAAAIVAIYLGHHRDEPATTPPPSVSAPATSRPPPEDKEAELQAALHDLEDGATCADRKQAIAKLVVLANPKAVPAIKKARARGKANACLRSAANDALKALAGTI